MGRNLGPLNIKDSYEGLVQISGSNRDTLTDGSGSVITNLNVTSSFALTASFAENVVPTPTGSFMVTGSVTDATLTFTKGDASTFPLTVNNVANAVSSSHAIFADTAGSATTATSASHAVQADNALTATSASHAVNSDTAISSSYALTASFAENVSTPNLQEVTDEGATTTNAITIDGASTSQLSILKNGVNNVRFITNDSQNSIVFSTSGSQVAKIDFNGIPGEIESSGDLTLDTQGGKVIATDISASGYISASEFIGPLTGNATTATSASHALNADNAISASYAPSGGPIVDGDGTNSARSSQQSASAAPNTNDLNIGGSNNTIASTNVGNYTIVGGTGNNIASPSYGNASIFGSKNGTITRGSDGTAMLGGINNSLTDTNNWSSVILGGSGLTISAGGKRRFMLGGENNTMGGGNDSFSGIIGGENNTSTGHERSVIIGGNTLSTTKDNEVVVPDLSIYGDTFISSSTLGTGSLIDNLGQQALPGNDSIEHIVSLTQAEYDALTPDVNTLYVISGSTAGGAAFPYTGSAEITGSLGLTGSLSQGETNSNLGTNTAILSSGDSLISASVSEAVIIASTGSYQSSTQPGRTAIIASDNSYIDSTSAGNNDDIALIGTLNSRFTGGGARQSVIAGTNNCYNNGSRFSFIGGGENHIMSGAYGNAIVGGGSNRMLTGANSAMAGGGSNRIGNATQTDYGFIGGGSNNYLDGDNAAIIAGTSNNNDQLRAVILGGESNTINGGQGGIVAGGINNTVSHDRSVILGGSSLSTTKSDEVVVPSLDINGTVVQNVQALTITSNTASLDASTGQMFTLGLQNGVDTHLELSNQVAGQTFSLKITNNAT